MELFAPTLLLDGPVAHEKSWDVVLKLIQTGERMVCIDVLEFFFVSWTQEPISVVKLQFSVHSDSLQSCKFVQIILSNSHKAYIVT